jgi:hypothetical protein
MSLNSVRILNGMSDLIKAHTPPPSLSIRSHLAMNTRQYKLLHRRFSHLTMFWLCTFTGGSMLRTESDSGSIS